MSSCERNKELVRHFIEEVYNNYNMGAIERYLSPTYTRHDPAFPGGGGIEGIKQFVRQLRNAFPPIIHFCEDQIAENDLVVTRWSGRIPDSGKIIITGILIDRVVNGKMVETWANWDQLGFMESIGMIYAAMD